MEDGSAVRALIDNELRFLDLVLFAEKVTTPDHWPSLNAH